jgi:hypothetical protein
MMRHITLALWCRGMNALGPVDIVHVGLRLAPTMHAAGADLVALLLQRVRYP